MNSFFRLRRRRRRFRVRVSIIGCCRRRPHRRRRRLLLSTTSATSRARYEVPTRFSKNGRNKIPRSWRSENSDILLQYFSWYLMYFLFTMLILESRCYCCCCCCWMNDASGGHREFSTWFFSSWFSWLCTGGFGVCVWVIVLDNHHHLGKWYF